MSGRSVCGCHGCRFEQPRLEQRIAELEQAIREVLDAFMSLDTRDKMLAAYEVLHRG